MAMNDQPNRPTDAELEILRTLWEHGPSTVREVHQWLAAGTRRYTTVLKTLQVMHEKGLVLRDESERAHVYAARYQRERTQRQLLRDLMRRAFGGSTSRLVQQALSAKPASADELRRIRELIDRLEERE